MKSNVNTIPGMSVKATYSIDDEFQWLSEFCHNVYNIFQI